MTPCDRRAALLVAGAVGLLSLVGCLVLARADGSLGPRFDRWYLLGFVGLFVVGSALVPATPVYLALRYGLLSPLVVLLADAAFWLVAVPTVGNTGGSMLPFVVLYRRSRPSASGLDPEAVHRDSRRKPTTSVVGTHLVLYAVVVGVEHRLGTAGDSPAE